MKINKILAMTILALTLTTSTAFAAFDAAEPQGNIKNATLESGRPWGSSMKNVVAKTDLYRTDEWAPVTGLGFKRGNYKTGYDYATGGAYATIDMNDEGVNAFYGAHSSVNISNDRKETTVYTWVNN